MALDASLPTEAAMGKSRTRHGWEDLSLGNECSDNMLLNTVVLDISKLAVILMVLAPTVPMIWLAMFGMGKGYVSATYYQKFCHYRILSDQIQVPLV